MLQPSGAKSWAIRYRFNGRPAKHTLGAYPALKLVDARELGSKALRTVAEGRSPGDERKQARSAAAVEEARQRDTIETVAQLFIEKYARPNTREASWRQTARLLGLKPDPANAAKLILRGGEVLPKWQGRPIQSITRRDVIELLDGIVERGSPVTANRTLAAVRKMFAWAASRDIISVSPCIGVSPPSAERSRDRVLADNELRLVWQASTAIGWPFGPMVKLLVLTLQRRDEVAGMRRGELALDSRLWTIPRERVKNGQVHEVPLSAAALQVFGGLPVIGRHKAGHVFTTNGETPVSGYARAKQRLDAEILKLLQKEAAARGDDPADVEPIPHWTFHDLRRTGATGMARLGVNLPVIEKVLNHTSGSFRGVAGVYQRHSFADEKREALEAWGQFVSSLAANASGDQSGSAH